MLQRASLSKMFLPFWALVVFLQYHVTPTLGNFCEVETLRCATLRTAQISSNMAQFNFRAACKHYKFGLDCLHQLQNQDPDCKVINLPREFQKAKIELYNVTSGLCGVDGSIDGCAYGATTCLQHVHKIQDKTSNSTCSEFIKMSDCVELLRDRRSCPHWVEAHLLDTLSTLKTQLHMQCFRTCDLALELCVTDVPTNLTYNPKITEEEQEVLCSEIETAIDCMNSTDIEDLCEQELKTAELKKALQNQTSNYKTFCSIPAKTCTAELRSCSTDVDALVAGGISTPDDINDLCQAFERAIECVNQTSMGDYCQGRNGARTLAAILNDHKGEMDTYCDPSLQPMEPWDTHPTPDPLG